VEILQSYTFKKASKSRYAPIVKALVTDGHHAVRIKRGEDGWPTHTSVETVQGAVSQQLRNEGKRARTFREDDDTLVISLWPEGEGPRLRRKSARIKVAA
jgi:hypothetical protein